MEVCNTSKGLGLELVIHHLCCMILTKAGHKAHPDSRVRKQVGGDAESHCQEPGKGRGHELRTFYNQLPQWRSQEIFSNILLWQSKISLTILLSLLL